MKANSREEAQKAQKYLQEVWRITRLKPAQSPSELGMIKAQGQPRTPKTVGPPEAARGGGAAISKRSSRQRAEDSRRCKRLPR